MNHKNKLRTYQSIDLKGRVESASPARLIQMLYEGLAGNVQKTQQAIENKDYAAKAESLTKSLAIVAALRESLDSSAESELPYNLDNLYDYIQRRLIEANQTLSLETLGEVSELVNTLKGGWDQLIAQGH